MVARDRRGRGERMRVAVLMGGPSSEHDVSLVGGANVAAALDPTRFDVRPVVISREGAWRMAPSRRRSARFELTPVGGAGGTPLGAPDSDDWPLYEGTLAGLEALRAWRADLIFPVLHGQFGEDGTIQACMRAAKLAFVGSGQRASAVAFDKIRTKEVLAFHRVRTPKYIVVERAALQRGRAGQIDGWIERLGLPLVLKNPLGGSSLEVRVVHDAGEATSALDELLPAAEQILVEAFIDGRELTAGVLEDPKDGPIALPIVEACVRSGETFDYHEKYSADGAEELCPAPIPERVGKRARQLALDVHRILGLRGLSRTDLRMSPDGKLWFLEVNTMPGMTERGLVPLAASKIGISFPALIAMLVRSAATPE